MAGQSVPRGVSWTVHTISHPTTDPVRRHVRVRGQVQGVGFRPFVYRLATDLGLTGWVRNDAAGVEIEVQGEPLRVARFVERMRCEAPGPACIDTVIDRAGTADPSSRQFKIEPSRRGGPTGGATPDSCVCIRCLGELFDSSNRRYRYAFVNCTHCGPRYTISAALPYDRPRTSMAGFRMCSACSLEYRLPADRRFHAQPNACPDCGPRLWLCDSSGTTLPAPDVIAEAFERIAAGHVLALKGLGGFHLVCDARNAGAVARLRDAKQREAKPFAVMFANVESIAPFAQTGEAERALLESPERPIVLLNKTAECDTRLQRIAPGMAWLGAMLPYTPLHYLLFHEAAGRPSGLDWLREPQPLVLVMTSANPGGEPLVTGNDEALARLAGIADAFVLHDRDILVRCDDSVARVISEHDFPPVHAESQDGDGVRGASALMPLPASPLTAEESSAKYPIQFFRRARGYVPRAIKLARSGPSVLACGGWLKNTVCLTRGDEAFVSQHIGDLDNAASCEALEQAAHHLMKLLEIEPQIVAHDLHPDFFSTRFAAGFSEQHSLPIRGVQHHHAHVAAVMAEHALSRPVLGLALDGVGLGWDGGIWGGELLRVDARGAARLGHLRELPLPGGDRAAREPWRMAAAALHLLGRADEIERRFPVPAAPHVRQMLAQGLHTPLTSSAGRWFDAAAGLLGVADRSAFEAQAAMLLETLAQRAPPTRPLADGYTIGMDGTLDLLPLLRRIAAMGDPAAGAALFHATLSAALTQWVARASAHTGLTDVALAGGCFANELVSGHLRTALAKLGLNVYEARQLPPNDGGLCLGQAWVTLLEAA